MKNTELTTELTTTDAIALAVVRHIEAIATGSLFRSCYHILAHCSSPAPVAFAEQGLRSLERRHDSLRTTQ